MGKVQVLAEKSSIHSDYLDHFRGVHMNTTNEIKVINMLKHVKTITEIGPRPDGTAADHQAINYIKKELSQVGAVVGSLPLDVPVIENTNVKLTVQGIKEYEIPCKPLLRPGLTPKEGMRAPLVFVGKAFEGDFQKADVKGKVVFCYEDMPFEGPTPVECNFPGTKTQNAFKAGAAGLIFSTRRVDNFIQTWGLHRELDVIPSVSIPFPEFLKLKDLWEEDKNLTVHLTVHGNVIQGFSEVVYGVLTGTEKPERKIVIYGSHHETNPGTPGANDNASGVAVMLELARYFSQHPTKKSLVFVSTCGEESGAWGSAEFVKQKQDVYGEHCEAAIIIDMVNSSENGMLAGPENGMKTDAALNKMIAGFANDLGYYLPVISDPTITRGGLGDSFPWVEKGIPAVFIDGYYSDYFYHTDGDVFSVVNTNVLKATSDPVALTIQALDEK
jgi:aminopeptidase YwaD